MKILVTGGNRGLGKHLVETLGAESISRANGFDITKNVEEIATKSLDYDVFINNAFDGPPHEAWANYGQINLLHAVYFKWAEAGKKGYIFNVGSSGEKSVVAVDPSFETYRVAKAALSHASKQCTASFKQDKVKFRTTLLTLDRLDTEVSRSRASWTGNGINLTDVSDFIKYCITTQDNTVVEEVTLYVNFNFKE